MGMDLVPRNKSQEELHYNWNGWIFLVKQLKTWGVDTLEFAFRNYHEYISAKTCRAVAAAIEQHKDEYNGAYAGDRYGPKPAADHVKWWRESSGVWQH